MNEEKTKIYLSGLNFGLKNKAKTENKHNAYKDDKFKKIIADNEENIDFHLLDLKDNLRQNLLINPFRWDYLKLNAKSHIRMAKTLINSLTYDLNLKFISGLDDLNKNESRRFTIKFYLMFYDEINKIMKEILNEMVLTFPKRAIIKRMIN